MNTENGIDFLSMSKGHYEAVCGMYKMIHTATGKVYVGSSNHLVRRKFRHLQDLKANKHQNAGLQKLYNQSPEFDFIFYLAESKSDAVAMEQQCIDQYRDTNLLLNIYLDVKSPNKGRKASDETREKIRQANLGKKMSENTKRLLSSKNTGSKRTEEFKERLSMRLKGIPKSMENREAFIKDRQAKFGRPVTVEGVFYGGVREAARSLGINVGTVKNRAASPKWPEWLFKD